MTVGEVVKVARVSLALETHSFCTCVYSQSPYQHKYDNDTHDQEASLDIQSVLSHHPTHCLRDADCTLANNNDRQQAHALHQMGLFEAHHAPDARYSNDSDTFKYHDDVPHEVNEPPAIIAFGLESGCHSGECTHADCIDGEHENEWEVDLSILRSPSEVKDDQILDGEKTTADD